ncbi:MAG: tRNA pseudouridine(13) synthase TruD [Deltaproteobacteria bacterium]|nr:tRNA pseudouridine(13) synthase TruD [Deltaproteobacteria bacterium]
MHTEFIASAANVERLPRLLPSGQELHATLRARPEHFRVEELPAYAPSGQGEHLFVHFEKTGLNTSDAVRAIARGLGIDNHGVGYAGMKDRRAVTTQWASFPKATAEAASSLELEGIRVLEAIPHEQKLRTGHLRGNRFELLLSDTSEGLAEALGPRLRELAERGFPNYFGAQRFGKNSGNLARAARWLLEGGKAPRQRFLRKLQVSSLQSALFNAVLSERLTDGLFEAAVEGDVMRKEETHGVFVSDDPALDSERVLRLEISPTGPIFGERMRWPEGDARAREERVLEGAGITKDTFARFGAAGRGSRRVMRVRPLDASVEQTDEGTRLCFTLSKGAYATVLLRELLGREPRESRGEVRDEPRE